MDQKNCEEGRQKVLDFKCEKIVSSVDRSSQKPEFVETQKSSDANLFASQTPAKTNEPLLTERRDGELEILERYKPIVELFDSMNSSLRLLALKNKSPTFQNISAQVEVLTQRKFSYTHIAQIKYLLPEAIKIDKILVHDKKTLCMKPDMKIGLLFDVVEGHDEESDFTAIHQLFASRLVDYFIKHPKACAIPEAALPGPFNQCKEAAYVDKAGDLYEDVVCEPLSERSETVAPGQLFAHRSRQYLPAAIESQMLSNPSHLGPSFSRHFSEKTHLLASPVPPSGSSPEDLNNEHLNEAITGESPGMLFKCDGVNNLDIKSEQAKEFCIPYPNSNSVNPLPSQPIDPQVSSDVCTSASPKCTSDSSVDRFLIETPTQSTPRRAMPSSDNKHKDTAGHKQTLPYQPAKRVLNFSYLEDDKGASECHEFSHDSSSLTGSPSLIKKVEGSFGTSSVDRKTCLSDTMFQQTSVRLPELVSLIHNIFQFVNFSPITKEELVHKIILQSLDIVDRREVEEHIGILEKQVPDWICRTLAPSGDVLYKIKKTSDLGSVQAMVRA